MKSFLNTLVLFLFIASCCKEEVTHVKTDKDGVVKDYHTNEKSFCT